MNALVKSVATIVATKAAVIVTLVVIGAITEHVEKKRLVKDAEHYANCPKNKI